MSTITRKPRIESIRAESLSRAVGGLSLANYAANLEALAARGIPEDEIEPRVNVFTYRAWQAWRRQVRKGEKSVRI